MRPVCLSEFNMAATALKAHGVSDAPRPEIVDDIVLVGAMFAPGSTDTLSRSDDAYLSWIINAGARQGIRFAANMNVRVCNLVYGSDFLKGDLQTKFAAFCMIYHEPKASLANVIDRRFYKQSSESTVEGAWHRALMRTGAQWAVNIHANNVELPTDFIAREPYRVVLADRSLGDKRMDLLARRL